MNMKIRLNNVELVKALKDVVRIIPSTVIRQSLKFVHISADLEGERLDFSASTDDTSVQQTIFQLAVESPLKIERGGACFLPGKELLEIVKRANGEVAIEVKETKATIKYGKAKFELSGLDPDLFIPYKSDSSRVMASTVSSNDLRKLLSRTAYATAPSNDHRPILQGVNFRLTESEITATASDGFRLSKASIESSAFGDSVNITIPSTPLSRMLGMLPTDEDEEVTLEFGDTALLASWNDGGTRIVMRALDGSFPDVSRIMVSGPSWVIVNRQKMIESCDGIAITAAEENQKIQFEFENDSIKITGQNSKIGDGSWYLDFVESDGHTREPMLFNVAFWLDTLRSLEGVENVRLGFNGQNQPASIEPCGEENNSIAVISAILYSASSKLSTTTKESKSA
ncbi:DNA polymerase III subunit beta [Alicyclobacillus fodiniaquatilis]|uniref:Beta sliding clamp n=1 Tax=Alicyclobacillus fodiniaquatilis TaxID=1661150 RepID=A0ABW4JJX4_9BACL